MGHYGGWFRPHLRLRSALESVSLLLLTACWCLTFLCCEFGFKCNIKNHSVPLSAREEMNCLLLFPPDKLYFDQHHISKWLQRKYSIPLWPEEEAGHREMILIYRNVCLSEHITVVSWHRNTSHLTDISFVPEVAVIWTQCCLQTLIISTHVLHCAMCVGLRYVEMLAATSSPKA